MQIRTLVLSLGLVTMAAAANAQVKSMSVRAGGVLCLSCAHRLEKAVQRVESVEKVKVEMEPVRAEVRPRGGAWIDPDRLRSAIKNAGFQPGDVRYTIRGVLAAWHGQPAVQLTGTDQMVVLLASPDHPELLTTLPPTPASGAAPSVEVEGLFTGRAAKEPAAPVALRVERVQAIRE
jgi:copper chaperone CopZ